MTRAACPRLFEVEAMRDGRLAGTELASFARHATTCSVCRDEARALEALPEALRGSTGNDAHGDELQHLRERTRLIAAFDATLVAPRRRTMAWRRALGPAAGVAAMTTFAVIVLLSRGRATDVGSPPGVVVHASAAAVWSKHPRGDREEVVLERGELWIHVDHSRRETKLVVALPDGELEDTGTTFIVSTADGRTTRVAVQEGSVVLRISGKPPVTIGGGKTWIAEPPAAPAASLIVSPPPEGSDSAPHNHRHSSASASATPARRLETAARSAHAAAAPDPPERSDLADAGMEFRAAVAVLDVGANREAAVAFARFLVKHPRDPRAEDAAYLQVLALRRDGATEQTRRAAQSYLQLYPAGFRRAEIEKLSR